MRILVSLLAIILLFPLPSAVAQNQPGADALLAEADVLIASAHLPEALAKTREAMNMTQDYHPAIQKEINILFLMNDEKESVKAVENAIDRYPDIAEYSYLRGIINNGRGKFLKALDDFSRAIDMKSAGILYKCYLGRGVSYYNLLEYDEALDDLNASIQQNDTVASAYYSRAMVYYEIKDYAAAVNDFQKSLQFSEGNAALYFNLGMAFYRLKEMDKACPNFNKSCSMGNINACRMSLMECAKAIPKAP